MTMLGRLFTALGLALGLTGLMVSAAQAQANLASQSKNAAIVVDAQSGEVLYSLRADSPRYPASVTKLMTLYLAFEAIADGKLSLDDSITFSRHAAGQAPTKLGLGEGRSLTVDDAIQAICVQSANDVAVALAEKLGGTESRFAAMMTLKAQALGMMGTHYVNASGLPDSRQISTARDLAVLSRDLMTDFPQFYGYFSRKQFAFEGRTMNNHNGMLLRNIGVDGLKTGFTSASGYNLSASAVRDNHRLIVVVLGGTSNANRDNQVADLLETGFSVLHRRDAGETITFAQAVFDPSAKARATVAPAPPADEAQVQLANVTRSTPAPNPLRGRQPQSKPVPAETDGGVQLASLASSASLAAGLRQSEPVADAPTDARYMVQVGAFRQKTQANSQIRSISNAFSDQFAAAEASVGDAVGGFFRARFKGLTADAAKAACDALKAKRQSCLIIAP